MQMQQQLRGSPTDMYWNQRLTPALLLGLNPGAPSKAAGGSLPPTSVTGGDNAFVPWSPDSPLFWLGAFVGLTLVGVLGASVKVRAFGKDADVNIGKS